MWHGKAKGKVDTFAQRIRMAAIKQSSVIFVDKGESNKLSNSFEV